MPTIDLSSYHQNTGTTSDGAKFNNLIDAVQGGMNAVDHSNIASNAGILATQLADPGANKVIGHGSGAAAAIVLPGTVLAHGKNTSSVSTSGTTFGTGADLLAAALSFTADGVSDYLVRVASPGWENGTASQFNFLHLNLDGADAGILCKSIEFSTASASFGLMVAGLIVAPSAAAHTVNVRLRVGGGTGTVNAGAAGVGVNMPIFVSVDQL